MKRTFLFFLAPLAAVLSSHADFVTRDAGGYFTYWDTDGVGNGRGIGGKLAIQPAPFFFGDLRLSYIDFDKSGTWSLPLEASVNGRLPFIVSPYAGIGAGYYFVQSDRPGLDNSLGYFGQVGADYSIGALKIFAELRFLNVNEDPLDGRAFNLGLAWSF